MTTLQLGIYNPWGGPNHKPHLPQCKYLDIDRKNAKGISQSHFVGGRGSAKTTTGVIQFARTSFVDMPGIPGFWSEPRYSDIEKIFLREWEKIVPRDLWQLRNKKGLSYIDCAGGTTIDLIARNVDNAQKKVGIGPNYGFGCSDEAAERFDRNKHDDMLNSIRHPQAPYLFFDTYSTPVMNGYYEYCHQENHIIIPSSSYDNPFLNSDAIDTMKAGMSPDYVDQEIYGAWRRMTGNMWSTFNEAPWPAGNIAEHVEWEPNKPWYLSCDLGGAQSSFQIIQYHDPVCPKTGKRQFKGKLAVVVAEILPNNMGLAAVVNKVQDEFCTGTASRPVKVLVGHDVENPGNTTPASLTFRQLGWDFETPREALSSKSVQQVVASSMILNSAGERRFAVAASKNKSGQFELKKRFYHERKTRGILNMLRNDTYPDPSSREIFVKDKRQAGTAALEDCRDCMLYWMILNHKPKWAYTKKRAA